MTTKEFSDQFDVLINSYLKQHGFGETGLLQFDEYEKSLFLSQAQEEFIISCYNGKNRYEYLFEHTEEDRRMLDSLIKTRNINQVQNNDLRYIGLSSDSKFYQLPSDVLFITYESCNLSSDDSCINNKNVIVVPTTQDEFYKTNQNPFRQSNDHRVLRLDYSNNIVELISKYPIDKYIIRYIKKPRPIILIDLPDDLAIDGVCYQNECLLAEFTHRRILDAAVRIALQSRSIGLNNNK